MNNEVSFGGFYEEVEEVHIIFFSILFILAGLAYIMNDARVSIFFIMGGILILPVFVDFVLKKLITIKLIKKNMHCWIYIYYYWSCPHT